MWQTFVASKLAVLLAGLVTGALAAPLLGHAARPVVRRVIKGGIVAQREIRRRVDDIREELEDIAAEVRHELGEEPVSHHHHHHAQA
jgi:hypothetical protein